MKNLYQS